MLRLQIPKTDIYEVSLGSFSPSYVPTTSYCIQSENETMVIENSLRFKLVQSLLKDSISLIESAGDDVYIKIIKPSIPQIDLLITSATFIFKYNQKIKKQPRTYNTNTDFVPFEEQLTQCDRTIVQVNCFHSDKAILIDSQLLIIARKLQAYITAHFSQAQTNSLSISEYLQHLIQILYFQQYKLQKQPSYQREAFNYTDYLRSQQAWKIDGYSSDYPNATQQNKQYQGIPILFQSQADCGLLLDKQMLVFAVSGYIQSFCKAVIVSSDYNACKQLCFILQRLTPIDIKVDLDFKQSQDEIVNGLNLQIVEHIDDIHMNLSGSYCIVDLKTNRIIFTEEAVLSEELVKTVENYFKMVQNVELRFKQAITQQFKIDIVRLVQFE
ncbi:Conserved_hypothetical protein [Hexamita inflata]|uniref:Uncharacterized protein n=1 Tax=Hexamita inflata TaxID=28002 RepID=A0ABP1IT45_9EUKA